MAGPLGSAPSIILGVGVGEAAAAAIAPLVEPKKQKAWSDNQYAILDPGTLARLAAQGGITLPAARATGELHGLTDDKMDALYYLAQTVPGLGEALTLWRRQTALGNTFDAELDHAIVKSGVDPRYSDALKALVQNLLSPAELANAIQQGHVTDEGILPPIIGSVTPPGGVGSVTAPDGAPPFTVDPTIVALDPITEAAGSGIDLDRLTVLANLVGLPPGAIELLQMWNRGIIDEASVDIGVREGHLKTKWTTPLKRLRWAVLSPLQYVDARVRGWITNQQLYDGGALSGYTQDQLDLLHKTHGRPLSWHQVWVGLQRGGVRLDPTADFTGADPVTATGKASEPIDDTFFKALQQSDVQQQWYDLAWAQRWNYPSAFVLRQMAEGGQLTPDQLAAVLKDLAWEPTFAALAVTAWTGGATATQKKETESALATEYEAGFITADEFAADLVTLGYTAQQALIHVKLADYRRTKTFQTKAIAILQKRYVGSQITDAYTTSALLSMGVPQGAIDLYLADWQVDRGYAATTLSQRQVYQAVAAGIYNKTQGADLLQGLGLAPADAQAYLDSPL
jgi:hypothetical protein